LCQQREEKYYVPQRFTPIMLKTLNTRLVPLGTQRRSIRSSNESRPHAFPDSSWTECEDVDLHAPVTTCHLNGYAMGSRPDHRGTSIAGEEGVPALGCVFAGVPVFERRGLHTIHDQCDHFVRTIPAVRVSDRNDIFCRRTVARKGPRSALTRTEMDRAAARCLRSLPDFSVASSCFTFKAQRRWGRWRWRGTVCD
jgi:hypothetical protein